MVAASETGMEEKKQNSRAEAINLKVHFKSYHMDLRSLRGVSSICNFSQYCCRHTVTAQHTHTHDERRNVK